MALSVRSHGNAKLLFLTMTMILWPCLVHGVKRPTSLVLYVHESYVPPSNTLIVSASPSGNLSGPDEFGRLWTVSNILRATESNTSTILGSQVGLTVVGKDTIPVYFSVTYFLNANATHQGTIAVHGFIDAISQGDRLFAVVGGTGDFLSATGQDRSPGQRSPIPTSIETNVVNVHTLTLTYPSSK